MTAVVRLPEELIAACDGARARGIRVGLVPTMGALHEGHLRLVEEARRRGAGFIALTIFVNPLQFGPRDDFDRYPRTLEADLALAKERGVDVVFAPDRDAMTPADIATHVHVAGVTSRFEGPARPGHFDGVATIVTKLFQLAAPCVAVFGRKDYQQWRTIERLARDLQMRVEVVGHATVREPDGLALSSRNRYLSADERRRALAIARGLRTAHALFARGERATAALTEAVRAPIEESFDAIDYVELAHPTTLSPVGARVEGTAVVLVAARLGATRLIDNTVLGEDASP